MLSFDIASAVSTDVGTAEAVQADQWLEALGGAPVRITNALNTSHPSDAWDIAVGSANFLGERYYNLNDDLLVDTATQHVTRWQAHEGVHVDRADITTALIALLAIRRADQLKRP